MRLLSSPFGVACALFLALVARAMGASMLDNLPNAGGNPPAPNAPAPAKPTPPAPVRPTAPPPVTPAARPAPVAPAAPDPELVQKAQQLRELLAQRSFETEATIPPLATLDLVRQGLQQYRQRVDRAERQPFLAGAQLPPDLLPQARAWQEKWGDLGEAIRTGRPPATIPAETLRRLSQPPTASGSVPVTGNVWAGLSNDYFAETVRIENVATQGATPFRESAGLRRLTSQMDEAEARMREIEASDNPASEPHRRELTWRLLGIWQMLMDLQVRRYEQQIENGPGLQVLDQFLTASDAARALRHRGLSLTAAGGAPVPPDAPPALLAPSPVVSRIHAQLGEAESAVEVKAAPPSQLAVLAAELYHAHYLIANAGEFGGEPDRRRDYEGRRLAVLGEIVAETNRVQPTRR